MAIMRIFGKFIQRWLWYSIRVSMKKANKSERPPYECVDVGDDFYDDGKNTIEAIETLRRMASRRSHSCWRLDIGSHLPWNARKILGSTIVRIFPSVESTTS